MSAPPVAGAGVGRVVLPRLREGTLAHALLLAGPPGVGKEAAAEWIARAAVCEGAPPPCGACPPCRSFLDRADLDLITLRPAGRSVWIEREEIEKASPGGVGPFLEKLAGEGILLRPLPNPAGRLLIPLRVDPSLFFRKSRGSPRFDRALVEKKIANPSLTGEERRLLARAIRPSLSEEFYLSTIGIGHMTGSGVPAAAGRGAVIPFLGQRPAGRCRKVVVIVEADRMTEEAQNALLKTLEEPPADSFLLLTSSRRAGLLDTIRSRCEQIRVSPSPLEERRRAAGRYYHVIEREEWEELLLLADGVPARAAEFDLACARDERRAVLELSEAAASGSFGAYLPLLESWVDEAEGGEEGGPGAAARRLAFFVTLARDRAIRAAKEGAAGEFDRADRLFRAAHGTLAAVRPGVNLRLLLEEFGVDLWRSLSAGGES